MQMNSEIFKWAAAYGFLETAYDNLINIILRTQNKSSIILGRVWVFSNNLFHSLLSTYLKNSVTQ